MRKVLLASLICFATVSLNAQIKKGSHFLGGTVNFTTSKTERENTSEESKTNSFNFSPAYGQFIKDNLVVGADLNFSTGKSETNVTTSEFKGYGAGVFIRKYAGLGKKFYVFGQGRVGANFNKAEYTVGTDEEIKGVEAILSFYPGVSYAVNNKFHIEAGFPSLFYANYSHTETKQTFNPNKVKQNQFSVGTSLNNLGNLSVGVRFILD